MAGYWSIIIPEATTNLITNPSVYNDATGFTAVGGSVIRDTTYMRREIACLKITPTAGVNDGAYYGTVSLTSGTSYTFSVDIYGVNGEPYTIYFANTSGTKQGSSTDFTAIGDWERQEVTWACTSTASYRLYITKNNDNNTSAFYIDGLQCEAKAYSTSYCDGNQDGCKWTGAEHASTSSRDAQSRAGGRLYNLDDYGFHIDDMPGIGMPPILHQTQEQPMLPGSLLRGFKVQPRVFDLIANQIGTSHEDLHGKRKDLLNAIKPDLVLEPQPFILQYSGANSNKPVQIKAVYDSGFQFTRLDGFTERDLPLRFIAYDEPYFYEIGDVAASLTTKYSISISGIVGKVNGSYINMNGGMGTGIDVHSICRNPVDGLIYAGGAFQTVNGGGTAALRIASWDGSSWSALGSGLNSTAFKIVIDAEGNVYAGGAFTTAGGSSANYIAMWDGSSWSALGSGLDGHVRDMKIHPLTGDLYVVGSFDNAGGSAASKIAKWDGSSWSQISSDTFNNDSLAIEITKDGSIYMGGSFTTAGGSPVSYLGLWDGSSWEYIDGAPDSIVWEIQEAESGLLYVGGVFGHIAGITLAFIGFYNGSTWYDLQDGMNQLVYSLAERNGIIFAGGYFTVAGNITVDRVALWNGYTWSQLDISLPSNTYVYTFYPDGNDMYIGFDTSGTISASYLNTVTNNGTRMAFPKLSIKRSGGTSVNVNYLKNETTGATVYLDYDLLDGEELILDFRQGRRSAISSLFGTVWRAIGRNSDLSNFYLLPGTNYISVYTIEVGSPTVTSFMQWRNTHWSADGVAT